MKRTAPRVPGKPSVLAGAASNGGRPTIRTDSPAARAHLLSQTKPQAAIVVDHDDPAPRMLHDDEDTEPPRRRLPIVRSLVVLLLILIIGGGYLGWRYTQDQYYVGTDGGQVAIFQGVNQSVAGVSLSHVYQPTGIPLAEDNLTIIKEKIYQSDLNAYNTAKAAYKKKWGDLQPHKLPKNRGTVHAPKFNETQPTTPPGCPGSSATSTGTGSGS